MAPHSVQTWHAFAKVNLELSVLPRRADGYHRIRTVLQTIDFADEIRVTPSDVFRFTSSEEPSDETNLVVRAVRAFEALTGREVLLKLDLRKRVPSGSGLGGGSSDAAVTLMGLDRFFETGISGELMYRTMSDLGSDVPFFYVGGRAVAVGRGERVFPLGDAPPVWFVLVCPRTRVSTAVAYSWLTQTHEPTTILGFCAHFAPELGSSRPGREVRLNDFEEPLFRRLPDLRAAKRQLVAAGARFAALSGSGSALFGAFGSQRAALDAVKRFRADPAMDMDVRVVRALGRKEYSRRMFELPGHDAADGC